MYTRPQTSSQRLIWLVDENPPVATKLDKELWRRYVEMQGELDRLIEGLGVLENWLEAKLRQANHARDGRTEIRGREMNSALSFLRLFAERIRHLPEKHLIGD